MEPKKTVNSVIGLSCLGVSLLMSFVFLSCVCSGLGGVFEIPLWLSWGWLIFLSRSPLNPEPFSVVLGFVCFVVASVCIQALADRLYSGVDANGEVQRWPWKRTFQLLALVVLLFLGGVASTGLIEQTTWLLRTREPWIKERSPPTFNGSGSTVR